MKLIKQSKTDKLCGQCCVAMVMGSSLELSTKHLIKHSNGTRHHELTKALKNRMFGKDFQPEFVRYSKHAHYQLESYNQTAILLIRPLDDVHHRHWVVYHNGKILCPSDGRFPSLDAFLAFSKCKVTSILFLHR